MAERRRIKLKEKMVLASFILYLWSTCMMSVLVFLVKFERQFSLV